MNTVIATGWKYLAGLIGIVVAVLLAWLSGKCKGSTEEKAKADVSKANDAAEQARSITEHQEQTIKVVKNAEQTNQSLSDDASRDRMRKSKYHTDD
ncbi:hypothetical protein ACLUY2_02765 [Klebsiella pneumoniae]|uniref:hypothetical protein n=1 Tax=Klebsiella pneumoniae TaxID=573 RepID=UPI00330D9BA3|nr:hypothetical protein [Klebsiella pneumoniae]